MEARFRSGKLLSNLSSPGARDHSFGTKTAAGSPRKIPLAPLNPGLRKLINSDRKAHTSDSVRTLATVRTVSTSAGGTSPQTSGVLSSPSRSSPLDTAQELQWRRLRERRWDASFANRGEQGIPDVSKDEELDSTTPGWQKEHTRAFAALTPLNLFGGTKMSWGMSQEMAANWAISLATNPVQPSSMRGLGPNALSNGLGGPQDIPTHQRKEEDLSQDYVEWYGSALHEQFLQSVQARREDAAEGDISTIINLAMEDQLEGSHIELRNLMLDRNSGRPCNSIAWADVCQKLLNVLINEVQIEDKWGQAAYTTGDTVAGRASEMLDFRDTTIRIIGALLERETALRGCGNVEDLGKRDSDDPIVQRLAKMSHALNLGISSWSRRFGHFAQLTGGRVTSQQGSTGAKRSVFLWKGRDALQQVRVILPREQSGLLSGGSSAQFEGGFPGATSGSLGMSPVLSVDSQGRVPGFRCEDRACRSGTRALRGLLRGGDGAAGQYVTGKYAAPQRQPTSHKSSLFSN